MFGKRFKLNDQTLPIIEQLGQHMPGGFLIYKADKSEEILYANQVCVEIFGCTDFEDLKALTGSSFKGMLHKDDYERISKAIDDQIGDSEEQLDHVEYRIVRKDGAIRWVDDYGHYTETEEYGGIYYVFFNDITDKKEAAESNEVLRQAVIEALSGNYKSIWLIKDINDESFSFYHGQDEFEDIAIIEEASKFKKYSDAINYYIDKIVINEDKERLKDYLSTKNVLFELENKKQLSYIYSIYDSEGNKRYSRIEIAKINLPDFKTGVVCGFKDIDDEEKQREKQEKMITALASDYWSVYYFELDKNDGICYQSHPGIDDGVQEGEHFCFLDRFTEYANRYIVGRYHDEFLEFINPSSIREGLKDQRVISFTYMVSRDDKETYEMIKFAGVRHPEDRDDHIVHAVGACITDVDMETRKTLEHNQALSDALTLAEEASKAKSSFLSSMSHEIRTPMNAIIGLDAMALNDANLTPKQKDFLLKIGSSAEHLLDLINDILDMSRIESGRMVSRNEEFSFSKLTSSINTIFSSQCNDKGLIYNCDIDNKLSGMYYIGDNMKTRQVLINILGNAVKFTPKGGTVSFKIKKVREFEDKTTISFIVSDTGIGMSKEFLPHVFDAFTQEDSSSTNKYGSSGLGMAITKGIVEMMNGNISVTSQKNKGTTFTVTFTFLNSSRSNEEKLEINLQNLSVLIVDDDPIDAEHARLQLEKEGIKADIAKDGKTALEMAKVHQARNTSYDLILIDYHMPEMDGILTTSKLREVVDEKTVILIITAYRWDSLIQEAKEAGVDDFLSKPLTTNSLLEEYREVLKRQEVSKVIKASSNNLNDKVILLAEDVDINAEIITMMLSQKNIKVELAVNGCVALEMFENSDVNHYDAILMDMRMPEMDGLEATRRIRVLEREDAKKIPIIALTANAFDEDVQRSLQAGLNAHLTKPIQPQTLFETLEKLIK